MGLAFALEQTFEWIGMYGAGTRDLPVDLLERALAESADDDATATFVRTRLAGSLRRRAGTSSGRLDDLDRAVGLLEQALDAGAATNVRAQLAVALQARYEASRDPDDLARAVENYRAGVPAQAERSLEAALDSAAAWGHWATRRESWTEAYEAFSMATTAADGIYAANSGAGAQVSLRRIPRLLADAAYAHARAGHPVDAALALEAARFRAGSEALELVGADLATLAAGPHADLASRLETAASAWRSASSHGDAPPPAPLTASISLPEAALRELAGGASENGEDAEDPSPAKETEAVVRTQWQSTRDATRAARAQFEDVVRDIQGIAGFEGFLGTPDEEDLRRLADRATVVYVAAATHGGLAVALAPGLPVRAAFLPRLTRDALDKRVDAFSDAYRARATKPSRWSNRLGRTTAWLWKAAMADVLSLVDEADRLVLIPAGTLGFLPLHAAWREDADAPTGRRHFCDDLVVSYAPNARSVARGDGAGLDTLLAVADPAPLPAPLPALSFAAEEVAAAQAWYPEAIVAAGPQATLEHVTAALDDALVHHYACHGLIDLREPRRSALVLADGQRLTVQQLLDMRIRRSPHGRLAILTACETALAGTDLPDEVISLPAALLQAGMTGVVATQWAVTGLPAALLSARLYEHCQGRRAQRAGRAGRRAALGARQHRRREGGVPSPRARQRAAAGGHQAIAVARHRRPRPRGAQHGRPRRMGGVCVRGRPRSAMLGRTERTTA